MNPSIPHNLPGQLTSFIGREQEIAEVKRLLDPSGTLRENPKGLSARLVTLTGAGGVGKTRLSLQVAELCRGEFGTHPFPDGVWFIELASLADPTLIPQTIASVVGVREQAGQPLLAMLCDYFRTRTVLLILDNCEHLIAACAQVADTLLRAAPSLKILASSRAALNIAGELTWRVPSLGCPDPQQFVGAGLAPAHAGQPQGLPLQQYESVRLFVERATFALPSFALTDANAPAVAEICQRLDGIPLALELAAARVKALTVQQIAARLGESLKLLTRGNAAALPRQQTLRAAIDWSHDLLSEPERVLLRRLAVFAGGWTLEAAEQVAGDGGQGTENRSALPPAPQPLSPEDVLDVLIQLVDKSLVVAEERPSTPQTPLSGQAGAARYRLLETIRQYAREKLEAAGEAEWVRDRHLDFFLKFAEEAEPKLKSSEQLRWLNHLEVECSNLRTAFHWAKNNQYIESGLRLVTALTWFWAAAGYDGEGREWLEWLLAQPEAQEHTFLRAKALGGAGQFALFRVDGALSHSRLEESIAICRELGDKQGLADALRNLGYTLHQLDHDAAARQALEESVALSREIGDKWGLAWALRFIANFDYDNRYLEESLVLFRELNDQQGIGVVLGALGFAAMRKGNYDVAKVYLEEALALRKASKYRRGIPFVIDWLGDVALLQGDYDRAEANYTESLEIFEDLGNKPNVAIVLRDLGYVALLKNDYKLAATLLKRSLSLTQTLAYKRHTIRCIASLASLGAAQGHSQQAAELFGIVNSLSDEGLLQEFPVDGTVHDRYLNEVRAQLDPATFEQAWNAGRALTLEQAIALAQQLPTPKSQIPTPTLTPTQTPTPTLPTLPNPADLTERELEVLRWLVQGLTDMQIAEQLVVSRRTVHAHLRAIYSKLDVTTRNGAVRVAMEHKLV